MGHSLQVSPSVCHSLALMQATYFNFIVHTYLINFIKTTLASSQLTQTATLTHLTFLDRHFFPCGFLCLAPGHHKCPQNNLPSNSPLCYDVYRKRNKENTLEDLSPLLCRSHKYSCCLLLFHVSLNSLSAFICCLQLYTWLFYLWGTNNICLVLYSISV